MDIPSEVFKKEIIYSHEGFEKGDTKFSVVSDVLDHWVTETTRYMENGNQVPIPLDHVDSAENNRGWVQKVYREGDSLYADMEFIGEDAILQAGRNQVSLQSPPTYTDGKGVKYTYPITHISLTPRPVIPGLKEFETIAASFVIPKEEPKKVEFQKLPGLLKLAEGQEITEDVILSYIADLQKKVVEPKKEFPVSPHIVKIMKENRTLKLSQLIGNRISPPVAEAIEGKYISDETLTLSLSQGTEDDFDWWIDVLAKNEPVELKQKTGVQLGVLSDSLKADPEDPQVADFKAAVEKAKGGKSYKIS